MTSYKVQGLGDNPLGTLVLDGRKLDARLDGSMTGASLSRTISGESSLTLTIDDPERILLQGGYYTRRADLLIDDLWFRFLSMRKTFDSYELTFADREAEILKAYKVIARAVRGHSTLAQFIRRQCLAAAPHADFVCPDLDRPQPMADLKKADAQSYRDSRRKPGINEHDASITVKGKRATPAQIKLMNAVLGVAERQGTPPRAALAMIVANIGEASYNKTARNPSSQAYGLFQLLPSTAAVTGLNPLDVHSGASWFLNKGFYRYGGAIKVAHDHPDWTPGHIASAVEGSDAAGDFYDRWRPEADKILAAYGGMTRDPNALGSESIFVKQSVYSQGPPAGPRDEDVWAMANRYADLVHRRFFVVAGRIYYFSDYDLERSRPRMLIGDDTPGVDSIDFSLAVRDEKPDQITITCRADRWAAPPGTIIGVDQSYGDAAGAWIVSSIDRPDLTDPTTTITADKPRTQIPEPAPQITTRSAGAATTKDGGLNAGDFGNTALGKAYARATSIDSRRLPYIWGGGHNAQFAASGGGTVLTDFKSGYDCSGAVSAVLHAAGIDGLPGVPGSGGVPMTTIELLKWGIDGEGKYMTVWVNAEHVFMEFKLPGRHVFFEFHHTGTIGGFEKTRDTTGFAPRHWPST